MNKLHRISIFGLCFVLCLLESSLAKEWHGIVPLHSTRNDVRRLLGKPLHENRGGDIYDVENGRALISYVHRRCEKGLPSNWGNWNVPVGTVQRISINLNKHIPLADLKIPDIEKYKWYTDHVGATYYHLKKEGIQYQVQGEMVTNITYGPTEDDEEKLLCKKNAPVIKF